MKRSICVVTGSRAEYSLLYWLMKEIQADPVLQLQIIATGMHLSAEFGLTVREIEKDGFEIKEKIEVLLSSDSPISIAKSIGLANIGFAEAYARLKPEIVVVLGDRFEIFGAATAALIAGIPIAHIHGGELSKGVFDEALRHSITKMSQIHFAAAEPYRKRIIQLGENPRSVFNVGALGLESAERLKLFDRRCLEKELGFRFNQRNLLATFHPVTLSPQSNEKSFRALLKVLGELPKTNIIFTKANADTNGRIINRMIDNFVLEHPGTSIAFTSLGQRRYLSALGVVDAVIGNSSSGLIEAPFFKIGTINIGDRQEGRLRAGSVIDCKPTVASIKAAIRLLYSKEFQERLKTVTNPYWQKGTSKKIKAVLKGANLTGIIKKSFWDIDFKT